MSTIKRVKGVTIERGIYYGNTATPILSRKGTDGRTHKWTCYVRGVNNEDISYFVKKVEFRLHETFENPVRIVGKFPFELTESGWGEFDVKMKIHFIDPAEKPLIVDHRLRLFPSDETMSTGGIAAKGKTVTFEQYDEVMFCDPTETMYNALMVQERSSDPYGNQTFIEAESAEVEHLTTAREQILNELAKFREKCMEADKNTQALQCQVEEWEAHVLKRP